jgi:hypothetical protein
MPASSRLRLDPADLERLLSRFPSPYAAGLRVARADGGLRLLVSGLRLPAPLIPAFDATFAVQAALVPEERNVVAVRMQIESLPFGLETLVNPFLDTLVRSLLPPEASAFVEVRSPSLLRVRLEAIPEYGRGFADVLTVTSLTAPGPDGAALEATFQVRPPAV